MIVLTNKMNYVNGLVAAQNKMPFIAENNDTQLLAGVVGSAVLTFFSGQTPTNGSSFVIEGIVFTFKTTPVYTFDIAIQNSYQNNANAFETKYLQSAYLQSQLSYVRNNGVGQVQFTFTKKEANKDIQIQQYSGSIATISLLNNNTFVANSSKKNIGIEVAIYKDATGDFIDKFNKLFFLTLSDDNTTVTSAVTAFDVSPYLSDLFSQVVPNFVDLVQPTEGLSTDLFLEITENWLLNGVKSQGFVIDTAPFTVFNAVSIPFAYHAYKDGANIEQSFYAPYPNACQYILSPSWVWLNVNSSNVSTITWTFKDATGLTLFQYQTTVTTNGWAAIASSPYQFQTLISNAGVDIKAITSLTIVYERVTSGVEQLLSLAETDVLFCPCEGLTFVFLSKFGVYKTIELQKTRTTKVSISRTNFQYADQNIEELVSLESQASNKAYFKETSNYANNDTDAFEFIKDFIQSSDVYIFNNNAMEKVELFTNTIDTFSSFQRINEAVEWRVAKEYGIKK